LLTYNSTEVQEIKNEALKKAQVRLLIKREDLNHPKVSGNKWWKLKYNLEQATQLNEKTILTFGGAFSNHIYSTAAAAHEMGFKSIGIIRGEKILPLNRTLRFAEEQGMHLHFVSRDEYKKKTEPEFLQTLKERFGNFYLIPEGGTNQLAVKGCAEFAATELSGLNFDYLCLPVGTAGTIAGVICGLNDSTKIIGFPVLKNGEFLNEEIDKLTYDYSNKKYKNWSLITSYHHGGYAKLTPKLLDFISEMKLIHNLPLDHVYTGKLLWGIMKEIEKGFFPKGSTILALHTGGLQGSVAV
jgi:1-aminocyclopropane-1-carboxylate deaminase